MVKNIPSPSLPDQWHTTNNKDQSWNKRSPRIATWTLLDLKGILHKSFYSNLMFWIIIRCDFGWKGPQHLKLKMWHPDYTLVRRQITVLPGHKKGTQPGIERRSWGWSKKELTTWVHLPALVSEKWATGGQWWDWVRCGRGIGGCSGWTPNSRSTPFLPLVYPQRTPIAPHSPPSGHPFRNNK